MLSVLAVENYRSLRKLTVSLGRLTVVTGANGAGKSNLYRALRLLAECAGDGVVAALAREGGLHSALWAGERSGGPGGRDPVAVRLGFGGELLSYCIDLGLPQPKMAAFPMDPLIKRECIWSGPALTPATLLVDRANALARTRTDDGHWEELSRSLDDHESLLRAVADPQRAPEVLRLRQQVQGWRFYDQLRTDAAAPARRPAIATTTPVLPSDGSGLAAAIQTIRWHDPEPLDRAVDAAFSGANLQIESRDGWVDLLLHPSTLHRPLSARELSDGTVRYLLWVAALLTPRPPELLVLNEPETSLHSDLIRPLAALITEAASASQIVVVTHSRLLVEALGLAGQPEVLTLVKDDDETRLEGQTLMTQPLWRWPKR